MQADHFWRMRTRFGGGCTVKIGPGAADRFWRARPTPRAQTHLKLTLESDVSDGMMIFSLVPGEERGGGVQM